MWAWTKVNVLFCTWKEVIPSSSTSWGLMSWRSSSAERDLGAVAGSELNGSQWSVPTGKVASSFLGCISQSAVSNPRNMAISVCLQGHTWNTMTTCGPWAGEAQKGPTEATGIIRGLEYFICEEKLKKPGLLRLENRRFKGNLITLLEYLKSQL